jgi:hypothetical protein
VEHRLGIDFGGVIAQQTLGDVGHSAAQGLALAAPVPNAFEVIAEMNELLSGRVWILSKAGRATESATREWLHSHGFAEHTVVPWERVLFVRERDGKLAKCQELCITHFIDDQLKNLETLTPVVEHLFLFGRCPANATVVAAADWIEMGRLLRQSLRKA